MEVTVNRIGNWGTLRLANTYLYIYFSECTRFFTRPLFLDPSGVKKLLG